jgi:predicted metal-binding membrane protein
MTQAIRQPRHLAAVARRVELWFARPKLLAIGCLVLLAGLGWIYLGLMLAGVGASSPQSPGATQPILDMLANQLGLGSLGRATLEALCRPTFGAANAGTDIAGAAAVVLMWSAMVLAMMLPTAAPMIFTYAEMVETTARKGARAASPVVLIAGYALVWLGFAAVAAVLQMALSRLALLDPSMASTSGLFSGAAFVAAGAYQFSASKHACLTRCQQPSPFFLANWSDKSRDVFLLGIRQGLYCVGCCWAMMLVIFAVGAMNIIWMAALGVIMAAEKVATTSRFSHLIGASFAAIGIAFVAASVISHWPVRTG